MENAFLLEILVPIAVFLALSVFFVMMFVKNSWWDCRKKDEKSETASNNTQGTKINKPTLKPDILAIFTCIKLIELFKSLNRNAAVTHHRSHGNGSSSSGESDVTFIDLPAFGACCSLQHPASDSLHAIHLHRTKKEDDPPPTYEMAMAMGYLTHEHHSCLHLV